MPIALGARRVAYRLAHAGLVAWWHLRRPHTRAVKCLLVHDGRVLFVRHSYGHRDTWELPGGSLRRGEVPEDAARREAREELGVDLTWRGAGLVPTGGWGKTTDLHCFAAEVDNPALDVDAVELVAARWASPADPPQPLGEDVPAMLGLLRGRVRVRPVRQGTYSIVARDPQTGQLGAAVQSHWFAVGPLVPAVRPGAGAVCAQSVAEPSAGPRALDLLEGGARAADALQALLAGDEASRFRQLAIVDARGGVAVHTGDGCIAYAGDTTGHGLSAQANMMASPEVWPAMAHAFEAAVGPLSRRLLAALNAAEAHGGDARGRQSAALVVAPAEGEPWRRVVDLRVDDAAEPLGELGRLHDLADAYDLATQGDELAAHGRHDDAADRYRRASALAPDNHELLFWAGLAAAQTGDMPTALERVRRAIELQPGWRDLLGRLEPDIAPSAAAVREALGGA